MRMLITGGTTFVSKYAAEYFVGKGNDVYVINRGTREQIPNVKHIKCDRLNLGDRLKNIHFDAVLDITAYNDEHIKSLINALGNFDDYIFISSSAVYLETNHQPFAENQIIGHNCVWGDYGLNKVKAERYLQSAFQNAYILRPPYFYGIYENLYREPFVFDCAMADRPFYIPQNGDMKLQFFSVKDLCRIIEIILEKHPGNHIYNVGNSECVTVKEWVDLCYKTAGKTPQFISVDKIYNQRDYFCFYDYEYVLDVAEQSKLMPNTESLEQGLKEEFDWYKNNTDSVYNRKPYIDYIDKNL